MRRETCVVGAVWVLAGVMALGSVVRGADSAKKGADKPAAAGTAGDVSADSQWTDSLDKAIAQAKAEGKVILLDFTGSDWCGFCKKLKAAVFDTDDFKAYAKQNLVLVEVDFPHQKQLSAEVKAQNEKLKEKYRPDGYPTVVFITPNGNELGRIVGFDGDAKAWSKEAADYVKKAPKAKRK